ncbi:MAG: glycine cleavage system protein T [Chloroflexi bacterium]|nr:glycine cleavage system protein T [Chloroflexota bacterium]MDK1045558.1 glycine cleavage T C-terminal barrel domain-containing protein [Anaerolineales bacterium]MCH8094094.1 glycine cleavage system protein T [Chloroflexota bacterium]MCH8338881.1 glycine cleavage system protein T [Chloroflexota bacterium]MCH8342148.1 glycine cleavage system protein T [Chloroflexota bacterium]
MTKDYRPASVFFYPRIRLSPYFEATQRLGAKAYSAYNHMYIPSWYGDTDKEYWALTNDVVIWDVAVERQLEIKGPDGFAFTNMLTPRDLNQCEVGQCMYVMITDENGGIINDPVLLRLAENHFWLSLSDSDVLLWAKGLAYNSKWEVELGEPDVSPVQVQGPKSRALMQDLFGDWILDLPYYYHKQTQLGDMEMVVSRTGYTGEIGYEIYLKNSIRDGLKLWDAVMEAGKPHNIIVTGPSLIRRLEFGIRNYGQDMRLEHNPYEIGFGWSVDLDQEADFIGKEALKRIKAEGITRKLVGVEIDGDRIQGWNEDYWPVYSDGKAIGQVTTGAYSPRLEKNIGYAMVPIEYAELGTNFNVDVRGETKTATVVREPFIDPKRETPKG